MTDLFDTSSINAGPVLPDEIPTTISYDPPPMHKVEIPDAAPESDNSPTLPRAHETKKLQPSVTLPHHPYIIVLST